MPRNDARTETHSTANDGDTQRRRFSRPIAGAVTAGLTITALVGGGYLLLDRPPQTGPLQTATVSRADVDQTVALTGAVKRLSGVLVTPAAPGVVEDVRVKPGDTVKAGQVLATMNTAAAREALTKAQANVVKARAGAVAPAASTELADGSGELKNAAQAANSARDAVRAAAGARERARVACASLADSAGIDQAPARPAVPAPVPAPNRAPAAPATRAPAPTPRPGGSSSAPSSARGTQPQTPREPAAPNSVRTTGTGGDGITGGSTGARTPQATGAEASAPSAPPSDSPSQVTVEAEPMSLVKPLAGGVPGRAKAEPSERQVQACIDALAAALASDRNASGTLTDLSSELERASAQMQRMSATTGRAAMAAQAGSNASLAAMVKAEAELAVTQQAVNGGTLVAGIAGEVTSVDLVKGETALPGQGISIAGKGAAELIVNVPLSRVGLLRVGQTATVQPPGSGKAVAAHITAIDTTPSEDGSLAPLYPVHVTVNDAPTSLGTGTIATATIKVASVEGVKTVPVSALAGFTAGKGTVHVVTDGTPSDRAVEVGAVGQGRVEIRSGLKFGETVVLADPAVQLPNDLMNSLPFPRPGSTG